LEWNAVQEVKGRSLEEVKKELGSVGALAIGIKGGKKMGVEITATHLP
jgi:hypothetical protein